MKDPSEEIYSKSMIATDTPVDKMGLIITGIITRSHPAY